MSSPWPLRRIEHLVVDRGLAMGPFGSNITRDNFVKAGVPVLRGSSLVNNRFSDSDVVFVTPEKANDLKSAQAVRGDLVFTHRGTLGQVALIPENSRYELYVVSQSQMRARLDDSQIYPRFAHYWFCSREGQAALLANTSQVGVPAIARPLASLREVQMPVPPLAEQRRIAGVLGALDDLIEVNRGLLDDLLGLGLASVTAAATETASVSAISTTIARGVSPRYSESSTSVPVLNQRCIRDGSVSLGPSRRMEPKKIDATRIADPGDVLVNSTGTGTLGRVARWLGTESIAVDSHVSVVKANPEVLPPSILAYCLLTSQTRIEALAEGSTGQTELAPSRLGALDIPIPSQGQHQVLERLLSTIDAARRELTQEIADLETARDELLPLLMSGRLRVAEGVAA